MARTARRKQKGPNVPGGSTDSPNGQTMSPLQDASIHHEGNGAFDPISQPPPPPPMKLDESAGGYGSYGNNVAANRVDSSPAQSGRYLGVDGYPHEGGHPGHALDPYDHHHLPPLAEAIHPDDAAAAAAAAGGPGSLPPHQHHHGHHHGHHHHHSGAHPDHVYGQQHPSAYDSHPAGGDTHGSYEHEGASSNFFDPQIMHPPGTASTDGYDHSHHHGGHFANQLMTPPPPGSSHSSGQPHMAQYGSSSPYPGPGGSHMFHRASISGPIMHQHHYGAPPPPGTPHSVAAGGAGAGSGGGGGGGAPPTPGEMAAWGTPSGSARPHTADGMFASQMAGMPGQWSGPGVISEYGNRQNRGSSSSISSVSEAAHGANGSGGNKIFSYMPGNADDTSSNGGGSASGASNSARKRPRRRYDEIERLYPCNWPGCQKSYGTLNHLNAHVAMQKHGSKRTPNEFKEMRKAWRKGKREEDQRRQASAAVANDEVMSRSKVVFAPPPGNHGFSMSPNGGGGGGGGGSMQGGGPPPPGYPSFGPPAPHAMPPPGQMPRYSVPYGGPTSSPYGHGPAVDANGRPYSSGGGAISSPQQASAQPGGGLGAYLMGRGSI